MRMAEFGDRCYACFPCLSDPGRRSAICLKVALVSIHAVYLSVLFLVDPHHFLDTASNHPWSSAFYLLLFLATLIQYFLTSNTSPGYVLDAMRAATDADSKQPASTKYGHAVITVDGNPLGRSLLRGDHTTSWAKLVTDMYPPGSSMRQWTCTSCNILQPPRAKHCHDCDKCVLQFDHHCVWLGTCIGQGNHCRFWWYICAETALCLWTDILYIVYLKANFSRSWSVDAVMIVLLLTSSISLVFLVLLLIFHSYLVLTNQTTYELVRRRRIPYMRGIPERVYPFSKGICRNMYNFCCSRSSIYNLEPLPSAEELDAKSRPISFSDLICCSC
ncbi:hypothetical protein vseg_019223 [Gypsophila vaccaria]